MSRAEVARRGDGVFAVHYRPVQGRRTYCVNLGTAFPASARPPLDAGIIFTTPNKAWSAPSPRW